MTYNKTLLNSIHKPLKKSQGGGTFNGRPTVKQIMQMPDKRYAPTPAVMNTKAGLAAAGMMSGPFSFIPGTAAAVYDLGTAARYAIDGQWDNAKEDLISAGLNAIPTGGVYATLAGMGKLQKAARARAAIRSAKAAMNAKDIAGSSTIRNNITGLVQEFDKAGKEIGSIRPRSAVEVKAYNQNLKSQYRTGYTPEGPAELMPFRSPDFAGGGMIVDPRGQWAHPGKNTRIPGSDITMQGVNYPVYGVGSNGQEQMMYPGQDYDFGGSSYVDEYPMMQNGGMLLNDKTNTMYFQDGGNLDIYGKGGEMIRRADGSYSKRGLWDNIRANKGSGKKPTKEMLEQEKKINSKNYADGGTNNVGFEALPEYVQAKILSEMGYGGYVNPYMEKGGSTFSGNAWYEMGGEPCYECGDMYADGGYYDCPDQEKDPVTGKCSAEVARGKEAAAANKAASKDMNAWAKQVAAMDKANAKQNAAEYAGQMSFDYDWMQSPVDKAEKKAAMAQYKQFFQQNPNTFVPDDTSGFSPEQKYIIANKLKQKVSTPMGSKAFQQKFNQDPRFMDLGRLQSDIVPMMGGWDSTRNYLFGNKKYGGIHINPANKGKFTESAQRAGMGVQEFASHVLANKEDYSSTQVKRANFAHNAAGWNKAKGGPVKGQELDVTPEELEMLRQQGYQFEIL